MPEPPEPPLFLAEVDRSAGQPVESLRNNPALHEVSREGAHILCAVEMLNRDLGYAESARRRTSVPGNGEPVPPISHAPIEYLTGLDLSGYSVLEVDSRDYPGSRPPPGLGR